MSANLDFPSSQGLWGIHVGVFFYRHLDVKIWNSVEKMRPK